MRALEFLLLLIVASGKCKSSFGFKSYNVHPTTFDQLTDLGALVQNLGLDYFSHASVDRDGIVIVEDHQQDTFERALKDLSIEYSIHSQDVVSQIKKDLRDVQESARHGPRRINSRLSYDRYHTTSAIENYMDEIASLYPSVAKLVIPTNSFNGRQIRYLKISKTNFEDSRKPIIFIDGGTHGREWLTIPPVTYAINKLVEDVTEPDLLDKFDWILLPMVNPDSYNHSVVVNAVWQKTRSNDNDFLSVVCQGVDIDRNFDFFWNTTGGATSNPCSNFYPGNRTFSEIETRMVRDIFNENLDRMLMYISMSSFGSMILYPWGHDGSLSGQAFGLHTIGVLMASAIKENTIPSFLDYRVGNEALVRGFTASGMSTDYAHSIGVPLTYKIELPGLFGGFFMLPAYIEQVVRETWAGIVAGARRASQL